MSEGRIMVSWSDKYDCFIAEVPELTKKNGKIGKGVSPIAAINDLKRQMPSSLNPAK